VASRTKVRAVCAAGLVPGIVLVTGPAEPDLDGAAASQFQRPAAGLLLLIGEITGPPEITRCG
jgi:hypothetical protein